MSSAVLQDTVHAHRVILKCCAKPWRRIFKQSVISQTSSEDGVKGGTCTVLVVICLRMVDPDPRHESNIK